MKQQTIQDLFEEYLTKQPIFNNKESLTISFTPDKIPHREKQINDLGKILVSILKKEKTSNIFIYGSTGTGKTLVTKHVINELKKTAKNINLDISILDVNCKMKRVTDTEYRLLAHLSRLLGKEVPFTGLPTEEVYNSFFNVLEEQNKPVILILDEIDALINKVGDELLYSLTRINQDSKNVNLTIIGISNNLKFTEYLDARVKSSLSEEELLFPPYNAIQIKDILMERSKIAFGEKTISNGVIEKCAALAAQEHGDARRALDLLRVAGELAERSNINKVTEEHINLAESKVDRDRILESVKTQPKQSKAIIYSIIKLKNEEKKSSVLTGEVHDVYTNICKELSLKPLTPRRISDILSELDLLGIITTKVISRGRYGRTREINLAISQNIINRITIYLKNEFYL
jgi:cell division control protein 6